jgi:NAD-dependent deacetylase
MKIKAIDLNAYKNIVILTGAGVSAESGLPTYRGAGGLWTQGDTAEVSQADIVQKNPKRMWEFFAGLRPLIDNVAPNAAHRALAEAEAKLQAGQKFTLVTQNIDQLHQRAGSKNVIEMHGSLFRTRCSRSGCELTPFEDRATYDEPPTCAKCNSILRPDVVLFGEEIPPDADWHTKRALRDCDLFIAIGTSGTVSPASSFVRSAKYAGAKTILVNMEPSDNSAFDSQEIGPAGTVVPQLFGIATS